MARVISEDLKLTVASNPHIQDVHFTKSGAHFFNFHEYKEKGKVIGKYGRLGVEAIHVRTEGDRKIYKNEFVPLPEFEIVETLTRDEILSLKTASEKSSDSVSKELKKIQEENEKLKAELDNKKLDAEIENEKLRKELEALKAKRP